MLQPLLGGGEVPWGTPAEGRLEWGLSSPLHWGFGSSAHFVNLGVPVGGGSSNSLAPGADSQAALPPEQEECMESDLIPASWGVLLLWETVKVVVGGVHHLPQPDKIETTK